MARDVVALIDHLRLDAVDVIGFSMGSGVAAKLLALRLPQVKSAILAGVGDYALEDHVFQFPKNYQPTFQHAVVEFLEEQWRLRGARRTQQGAEKALP